MGPGDPALALGLPPRLSGENAVHESAIERILVACQNNAVVAGIHCASGREAARRLGSGFRMVTVGNDYASLCAAAARELADARTGGSTH